MDITIPPGSVAGALTPPCSKSYAQRALAASLLAEGESTLHNIEFCDDTRSALHCIRTLGADVRQTDSDTLHIRGGLAPRGNRLHVGESGLSARLFTPLAALVGEPMFIEGSGSLLRRPMRPLTEALERLGVSVRDNDGRLPVEVQGPLEGGELEIDGSLSSQFVTGLLLALPLARHDTTLHVHHAVSKPYLAMTVSTAARFGVEISHNDFEEFFIEGGQRYRSAEFHIEGDWSAAAMLLAIGATAGEVRVENLSTLSQQADTAVLTALVRSGAGLIDESTAVTAARRQLRAFEFDATDCPDLFPALAVLASAADGVSVIRGTSRLEHKECHRAEALREEYGRLGIEIDLETEDIMRIRGGAVHGGRVSSHGDHRIAMSLAAAALRADGEVTIEGAECVSKSYPLFFEELERLRVK